MATPGDCATGDQIVGIQGIHGSDSIGLSSGDGIELVAAVKSAMMCVVRTVECAKGMHEPRRFVADLKTLHQKDDLMDACTPFQQQRIEAGDCSIDVVNSRTERNDCPPSRAAEVPLGTVEVGTVREGVIRVGQPVARAAS